MNVHAQLRIVRLLIVVILLAAFAPSGFAQQDPNKEKGFNADRVYHVDGIDSVNTYNGNLILNIPLGQRFHGDGALSYGLTLFYNGVVWDATGDTSDSNPYPTHLVGRPSRRSNAGNGWLVSLGRLFAPDDSRNQSSDSSGSPAGAPFGRGWEYESPDGASHVFGSEDAETQMSAVRGEASMLRMHRNGIERIVEFPDGSQHVFIKRDLAPGAGEWRLSRIEDRYRNVVTVSYDTHVASPSEPYDEIWTVREWEHGTAQSQTVRRTHTLCFDHPVDGDTNYAHFPQTVLRRVDLQGYQGQTTSYVFQQDKVLLPPPGWDRSGPNNTLSDKYIVVWLLTKLTITSTGESYGFSYRVPLFRNPPKYDPVGGSIERMRLPSGGSIGWAYQELVFQSGAYLRMPDQGTTLPPEAPPIMEDQPDTHLEEPTPHLSTPSVYRDQNIGVAERTLYDEHDTPLGTWTYRRSYSYTNCYLSDIPAWLIQRHQLAVTVQAPDGTTNITYYSNYDSRLAECPGVISAWKNEEYAKPVTHWLTRTAKDGTTVGLSTEVRSRFPTPQRMTPETPRLSGVPANDIDPDVLKTTYSRFEAISAAGLLPVVSSTAYDQDHSCGSVCLSEEFSRDWDDRGHFRVGLTWSNFTDGYDAALPQNARTTYTKYVDPPSDRYLLDLVEQQCSSNTANFATNAPITGCTDLAAPRTAQRYCYDLSNGFLTRRRTQKGSDPASDDVVTEFESESYNNRATGNVAVERYYGAADRGIPTMGDFCSAALSSPRYTIFHTYEFGAEKTAYYGDPNVTILDQDVDQSTGLVTKNRDVAGVETVYDYDTAGRLKSVTSPATAPLTYVYHPFVETTGALPWIEATQDASSISPGPGNPSYGKTATIFGFDALGRVMTQRSLQPDDSWTVQKSEFDVFGRKTFTSIAASYTGDATLPSVGHHFKYDQFGRVTETKTPDGSISTSSYSGGGIHEAVRTSRVYTGGTSEAEIQTTERYSATGQLVYVQDPAGPVDPNGMPTAWNRTSYGYDVGDRLASVAMKAPDNTTQNRRFQFNNLGQLDWEEFPEHGNTRVSYELHDGAAAYSGYDARGHLLTRSDGPAGAFDLRFVYDGAERLVDVNHVLNGITENVKHFSFYSAPAADHRQNGKLHTATRHNRIGAGDVVVTEEYSYDADAGRVDSKITTVSRPGVDTQSFTQSLRYSPFGNPESLDYPTCGNATPCASPTANFPLQSRVDSFTHNGKVIGVRNWADDTSGSSQHGIEYHPNGLIRRIAHTSSDGAVHQYDEQLADDSGIARPKQILFNGVCAGPPVAAAEPADVQQSTGRRVTLSLTPPATAMSYQWYQGVSGDLSRSQLIAGATSPSYEVPLLTSTASFWVRVGDTTCTTDSRAATVTVPCSGVSIVTQPTDKQVDGTGRATLSITVTPASAAVQWYQGTRGDVSTPAGTGPDFLTPQLQHSTLYWARVTAAGGTCVIDSSTAIARVCGPVVIVHQPVDATANASNGSASVSAEVSVSGGEAPYTFSWLDDVGGAEVLHEQKSEATSTYTATIAAGGFRVVHCVIQDGCGHSVSSNSVTLSAPNCDFHVVDFGPQLAIIGQAGQGFELSVIMSPELTGDAYSYEWFKDDGSAAGMSLGTSTQPTHLVTTYSHDSFFAKVRKSGCAGTNDYVLTPRAYISVWGTCPLEPVTISPAAAVVDAAGSLRLTAFTDWPNVRYDWYRGALGDTRVKLTPVVSHNNQLIVDGTPATYWVRITNDCGDTLDSNLAAITRRDGPNASCDPIIIRSTSADPEIASGAPASIWIDATSAQGIAQYQWRQRSSDGNSDIPIGGSSPIIEVRPTVTTVYSATMSAACGASAVSRDIYVHVTACGTNHFTTDLPATLATDNTVDTPLTVATSAAVAHFDWYAGLSGDPKSTPLGTTTTGSFLLPRRDTSTFIWARATTTDGCSFDTRSSFIDVCVKPEIVETADVSISSQPGQYHGIGFTYRGTLLKYEWFIGPAGDVTNSQPLLPSTNLIQVHPTSTTKYWVRASNRCGSVNSPNYIVSICPVVPDPTSSKAVVMPNGTVQLTVAVQGSDLTYHWYRGHEGDRSTTVGGNAATITTPAITATTNTFWVEVSSGSCATPSHEITVPLCESLGGAWATSAITNAKKSQQQIIGLTGVGTGAQATFYAGPAGDAANSTIITGPSLSYSLSVAPSATTTYWARLAADNGICTTDTPALTINVCVPQITTQPQAPAAPINAGSPAHLAVVADLAGLKYEWYIGQTVVSTDDTSPSIDVSPTVDTTYWVRVIGTCGTHVDSDPVTVTICKPPSISQQPVSTNALPNGTALSVTATGTGLSYQWYQGAAGTTSTPLGTTAAITVNPSQTTAYWVRINGSCGSIDSAAAVVSVCPTITSQPVAANPYVQPGGATTITVAAAGASIVYQWYTGALGDLSHPVGTNSATLNTGALNATTTYWVAAWSGTCQAQSQTVTVNVCNLSVAWNSAVTQVKANQTQTISISGAPAGAQATFYKGTVGNSGASTVVSGPSTTYSVSVAPAVTTTYWARIVMPSTGCYADTTALTITICIPTITAQPQASPAMVTVPGTSTMTVAADIPSTYQWYTSAGAISGATSATYVASPTVDTTYFVRVTGSCTSYVDSQPVTVTVCKPPVITASPVSTNAQAGATTLSVTATGTALTWQWYQGTSGTTTTPIGTNSASISLNPSQTTSYWVKVSGTCGNANSATATISVCPTITSQPVAAKTYVQPGTSTTITLAATGNPITYQWYTGALGDISHPVGTNSATLTTAALTTATTYWAYVTSGTCQSQSQTVTVNVCNLSVSWNAATTQVRSGQTQTLSITGVPAGLQAVFYRGTVGNVAASAVVAGPSTTYSTAIAPTTTTTYWARVTDSSTGCYADTSALTINVCIPQISQQPQSVTINSGSSTTLQVATDVTPATYQWYSGTTALTGKTAATMTVNPTTTTSYWVRVTGSCTTSVDSAVATVTVCQPPAISGQPADAPAVIPNQNSSLGVTATGTGLTYQWYAGSSGVTTAPVSGATSATFSRTITTSEKYWVKVTGSCGSVNSNSAWMSVYPTITTQPLSASINPGSTVTLTVQATGSYLHYQWYRNDTAHPVGTDSNSYATGALTADATYFVKVTSGVATTQSQSAAVTMCTGPSGGLSVQNSGACKTVFVSLAEEDLGNTTFRWFKGQKGDMSQPGSTDYYFGTCETNVDYWVRLTNVNTGCYTDTDAIHVY